MKVFADTNFLVSAFTTRGISFDLFDLIIEQHTLILGQIVLNEFERVLDKKFGVPSKELTDVMKYLKNEFKVVDIPKKKSTYVLDDEDDRWVLSSAIEAGADVIITGDQHFISKREKIEELDILTPREFLVKNI